MENDLKEVMERIHLSIITSCNYLILIAYAVNRSLFLEYQNKRKH